MMMMIMDMMMMMMIATIVLMMIMMMMMIVIRYLKVDVTFLNMQSLSTSSFSLVACKLQRK